MSGQSSTGRSTTLVAIRLPRREAAAEVTQAWRRHEAVAVIDPAAPEAVVDRLLSVVRPTQLMDAEGRRDWPGDPVDDEVVAVVVTSGTTGDPKAVELTAAGRDANAAGYSEGLNGQPDDRWLCCVPVHHVSGLSIVGRAFTDGTGLVVHDRFDLDAVAAAPEREGATIVSLVPTMLHRLLDAGAPLHRYRRIVVGGAPLAPSLRQRAEDAGAHLADAYGLTETWGGFTIDGAPLPGAEVRIAETGEVLVRGPYVMRGYRSGRAVPIDANGFLHTGDLGSMVGGRLQIVDRIDDLLITGGVNVSPTAVESVLIDHPDVDEVCVAGVPDPEWGQQVVAFVVARDQASPPTLDSLRTFARERLTSAQLPRRVVLVPTIPRTPNGKPLRRRLGDEVAST